ncbi:MAG: nitroreductase family deazaflavin-dependent oxidoreductase [Acidimicrobiales bacterium]
MRYTPAAVMELPLLRLHQFLYRRTDGRVGGRIGGAPALLLTTIGRKSGELRTCALSYLKDGDRMVVVASKGGSDRPPDWFLNLRANPEVGVQVGRNRWSARARVAATEERERLWPLVNRNNRGFAPIIHRGARGRYDIYQRHTDRLIPVVLLETREREPA